MRYSCLFFLLGLGFSLSAQKLLPGACPAEGLEQAQFKVEQGLQAANQNRPDSAIIYLNQARDLYAASACAEGYVRCSYNLIIALNTLSKREAAQEERYLQEGLQAAEILADTSLWKGKMYYLVGQLHFRQGRYDEAKQELSRARKSFMAGSRWSDYVLTTRTLARLAHAQQDFRRMESYVDEAYHYNRDYLQNDKIQLRAILQLYGVVFYRTGNYEKALQKTFEGLNVVLQTLQSREDTLMAVNYYNNIGTFYVELGDLYKGQDYFNYALEYSRQLGNRYQTATIYQNIAEFYSAKGQYGKAAEHYRIGLELSRKIRPNAEISLGDINRMAINFNNGLAEVGLKSEHPELAEEALNENLRLHQVQGENYKREETLRLLGELNLLTGDFAQSQAYLEQALAAHTLIYGEQHPLVAKIHGLMGDLYLAMQNAPQALESYMTAVSAIRIQTEGWSGEEAAGRLGIISDKNLYLKVLEKRIQLLRHSPLSVRSAYESSKEAVALIEEMRNSYKTEGSKLFLQQKVIPIYELAIELSLKFYRQTQDVKYLEEAYSLVERSRAMLLLDALKAEQARSFGDLPVEVLAEERRFAHEIAQTEKQLLEAKSETERQARQKALFELRQDFSALQQQLEKDYPRYFQLKYKEKIIALEQVQKHLEAEDQLLEYFVGQERIYLFAINTKSVEVFDWPKTRQYEISLKTLRTVITSQEAYKKDPETIYKLFVEQAREAYRQYLEPALSAEETQKLIIFPDGLFNYIPFELLLSEDVPISTGTNFKNLPYLLRRYSIYYHYSASLMFFESAQDTKSRESNGHILGFAPVYQPKDSGLQNLSDLRQKYIRENVKPLPGARQELFYLDKQYKGDYYFDEQALEANFKAKVEAENYSILHLAMHGWIDAEQPHLSNLVFSHNPQDTVEDNLLHAYELNLLNLNAELVVLSACETGFGKYERGEGVVSLGRGFMYAGATSLAMTLWPINDQTTAFLVAEFYRGLAKGLDKDEALRQAKLRYLDTADETTAHPFYWASFILLGDEKPLYLASPWDWERILLVGVFVLSLGGVVYFLWFKR